MIDSLIQSTTNSVLAQTAEFKDYISLTVQALTAIGTILLAIIALYGERVKRWLFRPRLQVLSGTSPPYVEQIKDIRALSGASISFTNSVIKLRINNLGSTSAQFCKGLVQQIFCTRKSSDTFYELRTLVPTPLAWSNDKLEFTVSPMIPAYLELCRIQAIEMPSENTDSATKDSKEAVLFLSIEEPGTKGKLILLGKGTFIIPVTLVADNLRNPVVSFIQIFWNGTDATKLDSSNFFVKVLPHSDVPKEVEVKL